MKARWLDGTVYQSQTFVSAVLQAVVKKQLHPKKRHRNFRIWRSFNGGGSAGKRVWRSVSSGEERRSWAEDGKDDFTCGADCLGGGDRRRFRSNGGKGTRQGKEIAYAVVDNGYHATILGDKRGAVRYGSTLLPMDEALILTAVDLSGRGLLCYELQIPTEKVGTSQKAAASQDKYQGEASHFPQPE